MNEEFYIGLNLFSVFLASCTQVILKKSAMNERLSGLSYFVNPATVTAYSIFLGCCLLTFYCLSHLPMITVNVLECSAYVYILFFDRIFFGKPITLRKIGERFAPAGGMNLTEQGEEGGRCLLGRVPLGGGMGHTIVLIFE